MNSHPLILLLLLLSLQAAAQTRLQETASRLDSLEQAMDGVRSQVELLDSEAAQKRSSLDHLQQRLSANQQLLLQLSQEQVLLGQRITEMESALVATRSRLEMLELREARSTDAQISLRAETSEIVRSLYAQRHNDPVYWLLSAPSARDALRRARLFPWFLQGLQRRMKSLDSLQTLVHNLQESTLAERRLQEKQLQSLAASRKANQRSRRESEQGAKELQTARAAVNEELRNLQADRERAQARSDELARAGRQVAAILDELRTTWETREEQRRQEGERLAEVGERLTENEGTPAQLQAQPSTRGNGQSGTQGQGLGHLRGQLARPVQGRLRQAWGMVRNQELGTTTDNPGADYACTPGASVHAVAPGRVARITWIPGYGNTVLLNHGKGYYTVYAKLESVLVGEGSEVQTGSTLGQAGTFDRPAEGSLHFELWQNSQHRDPETWFSR